MSKTKHTQNNWIASFLKADQCALDSAKKPEVSKPEIDLQLKEHLPDFSPVISSEFNNTNLRDSDFDPGEHFLKGWAGGSLSSKSGIKLIKFFERIEEELAEFFKAPNSLNRSLKKAIYNEFLLFVERRAINFVGLDDFQKFWREVNSPYSENRALLDKFIRKYTNRVAAVYFFKIRFIITLSNKIGVELNESIFSNPNSFLKKIFRENTSTALNAESLKQNIYSWYRPSPALIPSIDNFITIANELDFNEIIKLTSDKTRINSADDTIYSHSISHKNFGLFINSLLINFPIWFSKVNKNQFITPKGFDSLSTKFKGDYLESFSVSHWLAQYNNKAIRWRHVICPEFEETDKTPTDFSKIHNELQFLTFLTEIASEQGEEAVRFICHIFNKNNKKKVDNTSAQRSLFSDTTTIMDAKYDRLIINLNKFPKNNPTHFLINNILEESKNLRSDGYLYVLSDKKLFVPSQKDRLNTLLKTVKAECILNLEDVKGKGEIPSYIYIFSLNNGSKILSQYEGERKNTCMSFRISANLECFNEFSNITDHLQDFYRSHLIDAPSMYEKTFKNNTIQFYLDAIVNGRLIHSSGEDSNNITHPQFFNNLLKTCVAFDSLFDIKTIDDDAYSKDLYINTDKHRSQIDGDFVLIIDRRISSQIKLEIIKASSYKGISYEYGFTQCEYFAIRPKFKDLNLNLFREFFETRIGKQIISLQFLGKSSKLKSKLSSLLIPKFFVAGSPMPQHIAHGLNTLNLNETVMIEAGIGKVAREYQSIKGLLGGLIKKYPNTTLGYLTNFKNTLSQIESKLDSGELENINFGNAKIVQCISRLEKHSLFPRNKDIYLNFQVNSQDQLSQPLEEVRLISTEMGNELQLISNGETVVSLHSGKLLLQFASFLFVSQRGRSINMLLQAIKLPTESELNGSISEFLTQKKEVEELLGLVSTDLDNYFTQITSFN